MSEAKQEPSKGAKIIGYVIVAIILLFIFSALIGSGSETATNTNAPVQENTVEATENKQPDEPQIPAEHRAALAKAETYAATMDMSKQGIYDQLTSEYGEQFPAEAAQYAIDNLEVDWKQNALAKAKTYQETMNMSKAAIHEQLTSDAGEKFTVEEADYAIANL